jgi:glycosyltransferase involved in cell wall biosynthesis
MLGPFPQSPGKLDGGVSAVVVYLAQALQQRDDVDLIGVRLGGDATALGPDCKYGFPVYDIPTRSFGVLTRYAWHRSKFAEIVRAVQPDVIHAQGADLAGYLAVTSAVPSIVTVHGLIGEDAKFKTGIAARLRSHLISATIEKPTIRSARDLILISPYVAEYYGERCRARTYSIPNPVADEFFAVRRESEPGRILFAGRVIPRKGVMDLVTAAAKLPPSLGARLVIAGSLADQAYVASVRSLADRLRFLDRIEFLGVVDELRLRLEFARAQALALPSFQETAPMVVQEAMATGLPVVATRICGIPYQIVDGTSGYLVEPGDVDSLGDRLRLIMSDMTTTAALGHAARKYAESHYRAKAVTAATVDAYREVVSRVGEPVAAHNNRN